MDRLPDADYDALIIGARVAGASLALLLGQRGHRVLLVDRDRFPSDTLSTHFMGVRAVPLLARLACLDALEGSGFRRITRARTWVEDCLFEGPIGRRAPTPCAAPGYPRCAAGRARHRDRQCHLPRADDRDRARHGRGGRSSAHGWRRVGGGEVRCARSSIGADGKDSRVAAWVGADAVSRGFGAFAPPTMPMSRVRAAAGTSPRALLRRGAHGADLPDATGRGLPGARRAPGRFRHLPRRPARHLRGASITRLAGDGRAACEARRWKGRCGARAASTTFPAALRPRLGADGRRRLPERSLHRHRDRRRAQSVVLAGRCPRRHLRGADWDATMSAFKQRRDAALLPSYHATLQFTQQRDTARRRPRLGPARRFPTRSSAACSRRGFRRRC